MGVSEKNEQGVFVAWENPNDVFPDNEFAMTDDDLDAVLASYWQIHANRSGFVFKLAAELLRRRHELPPSVIREIVKHSRARVCDESPILCQKCLAATSVNSRMEAVMARKFIVSRQANPCKECLELASSTPPQALEEAVTDVVAPLPRRPRRRPARLSEKNLQGLFLTWKGPNEFYPDNDLAMTDESLDAVLRSYWAIVPDQSRLIFDIPEGDVRRVHGVSASRLRQINKYSLVRVSDGSEILCGKCLMATTVKDRTSAVAAARFLHERKDRPCEKCRSMAMAEHMSADKLHVAPRSALEALQRLAKTPIDPACNDEEKAGSIGVDGILAHMRSLPAKEPQAPMPAEMAVLHLVEGICDMIDKGYSPSDIRGVLAEHDVHMQEPVVSAVVAVHHMVHKKRLKGLKKRVTAKEKPSEHRDSRSRMIVDSKDPRTMGCLTVAKAAEYLGVPISSLGTWRYNNSGPMYRKCAGKVWYSKAHLDWFRKSVLDLKGSDKKSKPAVDNLDSASSANSTGASS